MDCQSGRRSARDRARDLGGADRGRTVLASRRGQQSATLARRTMGGVRQGRLHLPRARRAGPAHERGGFGRGGGRGGVPPPQPQTEQGRGGRGGAQTGTPPAPRPGLTTATFAGGHNLSFWVAETSTGDAKEVWHNAAADKTFTNINTIAWAGDRVIFQVEPEEWTRYYSVGVDGGSAPVSLTPQEGQIETMALSSDGRYLYYG